MEKRSVEYSVGDVTLCGIAVIPDGATERPGVLVAHDWTGRNTMAVGHAQRLAQHGYVGFALDMYGGGKLGQDMNESAALMGGLKADRGELMARIGAALTAMKELAEVDSAKTAAIGFCFGGLCVLDLARSGAEVSGVVSLHGLLDPPPAELCNAVAAKVLVLHGYRDPLVPRDQLAAFEHEMAAGDVDFQVHSYGNAAHAFTNPAAKGPKLGAVYEPLTATRALRSTDDFLRDLFA